MADSKPQKSEQGITRERLAELLNEDLSREYQAIIAYVVYSQVLKGAAYMNIADQLETHAHDDFETNRLPRKNAVGDTKACADV
jgi:bacterioferritin